jgi:hypothetical protein
MAASFVTNGVLHRDLFAQNCRELLFVWIRISDFTPGWRERMGNPGTVRNLETVANGMIEDEKRQGSFEAFRKMVRGA